MISHQYLRVVLLGLALTLGACASDTDDVDASVETALADTQALPYSTELNGLKNLPGINETVRAVSRTFRLVERGAASAAALQRRAERDIPDMKQVLRAEGFYDAEVTASVTTPPAGEPVAIFEVTSGTQYMIGSFNPVFEPRAENLPTETDIQTASGLKAGAPARGQAIVDAEAGIVRYLQRHGFPDARFVDRKAMAHPDAATLDVTSRFDPGRFAQFGDLQIPENSSLDRDYILRLVPWSSGDIWDQRQIESFQSALRSSGLFTTVSIKPAESDAASLTTSERDLVLQVENAKQRSIGGSLRYDTDQGPGVRLFWRHRNLTGEAEDFRVEADMLLEEQKLRVGVSRPQHPAKGWSSSESLTLRRLIDDAFDEKSATLRSGMDLNAGEGWTIGGTLEGIASITDTDFASETAYLVGLPLFAKRDRTDNPLDATRGYRLSVNAGPYLGLNNGEPIQFGVVGAGGSVYVPLIGDNRLVLAIRTRISSVLSQDLDDVPINQRLFGGGGASIRGFEFQSISPVNAQNDLTGGRFLNENSVELRLRLTEDFGVVGFVDSGIVEEESFPSFQERMNVGVGGGFRYYSPVGPLRFDIAFPLARRVSDNVLEFYISLGQAF